MIATEQGSEAVSVRPFSAPLGAEISCGDVRKIGPEVGKALYTHLLQHLVLVFREQSLNPAELVQFAGYFGTPREASAVSGGRKAPPNPFITVISNVIENGLQVGALGDGEAVWHTDNSFRERPLAVSVLYALEVPARGGDTGFANMYAALDALPQNVRATIAGKAIKHDTSGVGYDTGAALVKSSRISGHVRDLPGITHPIIRTHPDTRHNALYLGRRHNAYIEGCSIDDSEERLDALWSHATEERFTWFHSWRAGDIVVWDNRCVMHMRRPFDPTATRIMHRTQCQGERPIHDEDSSAQPHPRSALTCASAQ